MDLTGLSGYDIQGSLDASVPDVAMFAIDITDYADFSAQTLALPYGITDTELFLFNASGMGVYGNDDSGLPGADFTLACLPSAGSSNPCPSSAGGLGPTSDGLYYLAVAYSPDTPLDGMGNPIFVQTGSSTDIVGPAGSGVIASWDGSVYTQPDYDNNQYFIQLTGVPEPSTLLLLSPGAFALWLRKRFFKS